MTTTTETNGIPLPAGAEAISDPGVRKDGRVTHCFAIPMRGDRVEILFERDYVTGDVLESHIQIPDGRSSIEFDPEMLPDVRAAVETLSDLMARIQS